MPHEYTHKAQDGTGQVKHQKCFATKLSGVLCAKGRTRTPKEEKKNIFKNLQQKTVVFSLNKKAKKKKKKKKKK